MILICGAVPAELAPIHPALTETESIHIGGRSALRGKVGMSPVITLETGVGQANAVQAITAAIETHRVKLVLSTGCAGGYQSANVTIGDVVVASEEIDAHLGIETTSGSGIPDRFPMPVLHHQDTERPGRYPASPEWIDRALDQGRLKGDLYGFNAVSGPCVTVGTVTATDRRSLELREAWHPAAESMEGAGAAHVALHYNIDWLEIRGISNPVGQRDRDSWDIPLACAHAGLVVSSLITDIGTIGDGH